MFCNKCDDEVTDGVVCSSCDGNLHYDCSGISEVSYRKMGPEKKATWKCWQCRNQGKVADNGILKVLNEIKLLRSEFSPMKSDIHKLTCGVDNLNTKFEEMESRFCGLEDRVTVIEKNSSITSKLQKDLAAANMVITTLQCDKEKSEQFSRLNNLEISGVPVTSGENVHSILDLLCVKVGVGLDERDVDRVHRVRRFEAAAAVGNLTGRQQQQQPARHPAIIVRFTRRVCKDRVLAATRARRGLTSADLGLPGPSSNIYVGDHLTPASKLLLRRARELKAELGYEYLWVRDGKILMRKSDKSRVILIIKNEDFEKLK
ncbi:uncharacterized protein LOC113238568 [Hyposmocoma kahamanoa]|uniref:uncharacterized protein LOC113238568 n=1 Tax=Hyposmocoma kahamanoa TaxID=1477025 RepID=UPI000E6D82F4|nr:uncharacterized protein LOC113238568 [Hyposmocoma kahamanoa]